MLGRTDFTSVGNTSTSPCAVAAATQSTAGTVSSWRFPPQELGIVLLTAGMQPPELPSHQHVQNQGCVITLSTMAILLLKTNTDFT